MVSDEQVQAAREFMCGSAWSGVASAPDSEAFWLATLLATLLATRERAAYNRALEDAAKVAEGFVLNSPFIGDAAYIAARIGALKQGKG